VSDIAIAIFGVGAAFAGVYQQSHNHDGSGWGIIAFISFIILVSNG